MKIKESQIKSLISEALQKKLLLNELVITSGVVVASVIIPILLSYAAEKAGDAGINYVKQNKIKELLSDEKIKEYSKLPEKIYDILVYAKRLKNKGKKIRKKGDKKKGNDFVTLSRKLEKSLSLLESDYIELISIVNSDVQGFSNDAIEKTSIGAEGAFGATGGQKFLKHYIPKVRSGIKPGKPVSHFMGTAGRRFALAAFVLTLSDLGSKGYLAYEGIKNLEKIIKDKNLFKRSKFIFEIHDVLSKNKNEKGYFKLPGKVDINSIAGIAIDDLNK